MSESSPSQETPTHTYLYTKIFIAAAIYSPTPTKMQYHQHHRA